MDHKSKNWFHILSEIPRLNEMELEEYFNDQKTRDAIYTAASELKDDNDIALHAMSKENFISLVYELHEIQASLGRKVGDVIISASDIAEIGDIEGAINTLEKFIKNCTSSFYRKQAKNQIEYYRGRM